MIIPLLVTGLGVVVFGAVVMLKPSSVVYPFAPRKVDPSADTMAGEAETVFADDGWTVITLTSLSEVEDLLDCLEAQKFAQREVRVMGNSRFRVRWK